MAGTLAYLSLKAVIPNRVVCGPAEGSALAVIPLAVIPLSVIPLVLLPASSYAVIPNRRLRGRFEGSALAVILFGAFDWIQQPKRGFRVTISPQPRQCAPRDRR